MKTQKTIKHDSLALKIVDGKAWVKLTINRRGWKVTANSETMRGTMEKTARLFQEAVDVQGMAYGAALDYVEAGMA